MSYQRNGKVYQMKVFESDKAAKARSECDSSIHNIYNSKAEIDALLAQLESVLG